MTVKTAFSSMAYHTLSVEDLAKKASQLGYDGIELLWREGMILNESIRPSDLRRVRRVCAGAGIRIFSISGYTRFAGHDGVSRERELDLLKRQLDAAAELDAEGVRTLGGKVSEEDWQTDSQRHVELLAGYLRRAADHSEGTNVRVLLATHDSFSTASAAVRVLDAAAHEGISLIWCVIHPFQYGEDLDTTWRVIQGRFALVHLKDAVVGALRQWWPLRPLGRGNLPLEAICRLIDTSDFSGPVSIEWEYHMHPEIEDSSIALAAGIEYLRRHFLSGCKVT